MNFRSPLVRAPFACSLLLGLNLLGAPEVEAATQGSVEVLSEEEEEEEEDTESAEKSDEGDKKAAKAASAAASAAPMKGRWGLGATHSISGLNGLSVRYYVMDQLSLGMMAGFAMFTHSDADENGEYGNNRTVGYFGVGPQLFWWPVQGNRSKVVSADFGVGTRVLFYLGFNQFSGDPENNTIDNAMEIDIEIPMATNIFIGQRVAITPEFGLTLRIIPGTREPDENGDIDENPGTGAGSRLGTTNGPGFGVELGDAAGLFMGLSVTYFFPK